MHCSCPRTGYDEHTRYTYTASYPTDRCIERGIKQKRGKKREESQVRPNSGAINEPGMTFREEVKDEVNLKTSRARKCDYVSILLQAPYQ